MATVSVDRRGERATALVIAVLVGLGLPVIADPSIVAADPGPPVEISYDPATPLNRDQLLTVTAQGGTYRLEIAGETTSTLAPDASATEIETALEALSSADLDSSGTAELTVSGGPGGGNGGNHYLMAFDESPPGGDFPEITTTDLALTGYLGPSATTQCVRCGDLQLPEGSPPTAGWPTVVLAHSGGFSAGAKDPGSDSYAGARMQRWAAELAGAGYASLAVNYTLADPATIAALYNSGCDIDLPDGGGGCGQPLRDAITDMRHDLAASVRWLRWTTQPAGSGGLDNPYGLDPSSIAMLGESAGASGALDLLYRPDDPGSVGVTGPSSDVAAVVSIAGFVDDSHQDPGEGAALLMGFTNDVMGELFGFDMFDESREVLAASLAAGNDRTRLTASCVGLDINGDGNPDPQHLPELTSTEFADQVAEAVTFLNEMFGLSPPAGDQLLFGAGRTTPFEAIIGQRLAGGHEPVIGDFDGDGRDDLYLHGPGPSCDTAWYGRTDRTFDDPDEVVSGALVPVAQQDGVGMEAVVVADLDGDGRDDIIWYDDDIGDTVIWYGQPDRTFDSHVFAMQVGGLDWSSGDFDGDGRDDIIADFRAWAVAGYGFGSATRGTFEDAALQAKPTSLDPHVGDLDGDGRDDILWYDHATGLDVRFWTPTTRSFSEMLHGDVPAGVEIEIADVDGDGISDVNAHFDGMLATFGGTPSFSLPLIALSSVDAGATLTSGDVDNDSAADLIWEWGASFDLWFGELGGSPPFTERRPDLVNPGASQVLGDVDGDGATDLIVATD